MKTFNEKFKKDIKRFVVVHKSVKGRRLWAAMCWTIYVFVFLFFLGAAYLFVRIGLVFNDLQSDEPPRPMWEVVGWNSESWKFLLGGLACFISGSIIGIFFAFYLPGVYKESQEIYLNSKEYRANRNKYSAHTDLEKLNKGQLKWLMKLKFIDKFKYKSTLEAKARKRKEK